MSYINNKINICMYFYLLITSPPVLNLILLHINRHCYVCTDWPATKSNMKTWISYFPVTVRPNHVFFLYLTINFHVVYRNISYFWDRWEFYFRILKIGQLIQKVVVGNLFWSDASVGNKKPHYLQVTSETRHMFMLSDVSLVQFAFFP